MDLGQEWLEWTGLPFVYAVWSARPGVFAGGLGERLLASAEYGLGCVDAIIAAEAGPRGLDPSICREYLAEIIRHRLGAEEAEGLTEFLGRVERIANLRARKAVLQKE